MYYALLHWKVLAYAWPIWRVRKKKPFVVVDIQGRLGLHVATCAHWHPYIPYAIVSTFKQN